MERINRTVIAFLLVLTAWAYWPSHESQFVFEDRPATSAPSVSVTHTLMDSAQSLMPRSLTALSMQMQAGQSAFAHRLVNLSVHLLNGLLVFGLSQSLWVLAIFWLHPMWSESVAYTAARADLLLVTATLLTLCLLNIRSAWGAVIGATVGTALALGAKEAAVTLPALVLLWLWASRKLSRPWIAYGAGCFIAMLYESWRMTAYLSSWTAPASVTGWRFAALQAGAFWRLLSLIIPIGLTPVHAWEWMSPIIAAVGLIGIGIALMSALMCAVRDARWLTVAILWPILALAPRFVIPLPNSNLLTEHHLPYACVGSLLAVRCAFQGAVA